MKSNIVEFVRTKDYKFLKDIGQGGLGITVLLEDESIGEQFVCKKYMPFDEGYKEIYYKNFVDEIKLLHLLYHNNIVRVFNYYLYPNHKTGYILMEYIDGSKISDFIEINPDRLDDVFIQTIRGFRHLEENNILHRDIRPENILVSNEGTLKIIDFGFGKKIEFEGDFDNSISLNWRYAKPEDFTRKVYNFCTEIYFVGKLFEEVIQENNLENFSYNHILRQMILNSPDNRIDSFFEIERKIIEEGASGIEFSSYDKLVYQKFAGEIVKVYSKIEYGATYIKDVEAVIKALDDIYRNSLLEDEIQNPLTIARCFIKGQYFYSKNATVHVTNLKEFLQVFKALSSDKQKIMINNLWQRFDVVPRYDEPEDDGLPF